jgi:hypothetical protein
LRKIVRTGEAQVIDGVEVSPQLAEMVVTIHDGLTPYEQEVFAADCNADFRACVRACAAFQAALPLARVLLHLLRASDPTQTGMFWG